MYISLDIDIWTVDTFSTCVHNTREKQYILTNLNIYLLLNFALTRLWDGFTKKPFPLKTALHLLQHDPFCWITINRCSKFLLICATLLLIFAKNIITSILCCWSIASLGWMNGNCASVWKFIARMSARFSKILWLTQACFFLSNSSNYANFWCISGWRWQRIIFICFIIISIILKSYVIKSLSYKYLKPEILDLIFYMNSYVMLLGSWYQSPFRRSSKACFYNMLNAALCLRMFMP